VTVVVEDELDDPEAFDAVATVAVAVDSPVVAVTLESIVN
jgi:hypothetical protein